MTCWGMSRVPILLLALFPKLARLFFLCRCLPFLWFSLVLFLLHLRVGFGLNLVPFWGCLNFVLPTLVCFAGSFKSFKMMLSKFFAYPFDAPPSSLCDPKKVQRVGFAEMVRNLVPLPTSSTKRGRGVVLEASGLD
jgi:hypothetical protein